MAGISITEQVVVRSMDGGITAATEEAMLERSKRCEVGMEEGTTMRWDGERAQPLAP